MRKQKSDDEEIEGGLGFGGRRKKEGGVGGVGWNGVCVEVGKEIKKTEWKWKGRGSIRLPVN